MDGHAHTWARSMWVTRGRGVSDRLLTENLVEDLGIFWPLHSCRVALTRVWGSVECFFSPKKSVEERERRLSESLGVVRQRRCK